MRKKARKDKEVRKGGVETEGVGKRNTKSQKEKKKKKKMKAWEKEKREKMCENEST